MEHVIDYGQNQWTYNTGRKVIKTTTTREFNEAGKLVKETTVVEEEVYPHYNYPNTWQPLYGGAIGDYTLTNGVQESLTHRAD